MRLISSFILVRTIYCVHWFWQTDIRHSVHVHPGDLVLCKVWLFTADWLVLLCGSFSSHVILLILYAKIHIRKLKLILCERKRKWEVTSDTYRTDKTGCEMYILFLKITISRCWFILNIAHSINNYFDFIHFLSSISLFRCLMCRPVILKKDSPRTAITMYVL